jgi:hypothetical protein
MPQALEINPGLKRGYKDMPSMKVNKTDLLKRINTYIADKQKAKSILEKEQADREKLLKKQSQERAKFAVECMKKRAKDVEISFEKDYHSPWDKSENTYKIRFYLRLTESELSPILYTEYKDHEHEIERLVREIDEALKQRDYFSMSLEQTVLISTVSQRNAIDPYLNYQPKY